MKCSCTVIAAVAQAMLGSACTTQSAYQTGQEWQRQQCLKLPDLAERQRCEKSTAMGYDQYKAQAEAVKNKPTP